MFTKKQVDSYFDFAFTDIANNLAYWEQHKGDDAKRHIEGLRNTREFLETNRKNIVQVGKDKYQLMVNMTHPDKSYIHGSIQLVMSIQAFAGIKVIKGKPVEYDGEKLQTNTNDSKKEVENTREDTGTTINPTDS